MIGEVCALNSKSIQNVDGTISKSLCEFTFGENALGKIALAAGHLQIVVSGRSTLRFRYHMIHVDLSICEIFIAIHTPESIAFDHSFT